MIVFIAYKDLKKAAHCLSNRDLPWVARNALVVFKALDAEEGVGWTKHPSTLMWLGYEVFLVEYTLLMVKEMERRGIPCAGFREFFRARRKALREAHVEHVEPSWLGCKKIHKSHRRRLIDGDRLRYAPMWPKLKPSPYVRFPDGQKIPV